MLTPILGVILLSFMVVLVRIALYLVWIFVGVWVVHGVVGVIWRVVGLVQA